MKHIEPGLIFDFEPGSIFDFKLGLVQSLTLNRVQSLTLSPVRSVFKKIQTKQAGQYLRIRSSIIFGPGGFVCATRGGIAMCSWPLLLPTFGLSSFGPGGFVCATQGGVCSA